MVGRLALIAILLAGAVGGLYFVARSILEDRAALSAVSRSSADEEARDAEWEAARGLPEGRRKQSVDPEPAPVEEQKPDQPEPEESGKPISPPEITTAYADLVLELARPKEQEERSILVKVTDTEGEPLENVLVVVRDQGSVIYRERTDETGAIEFEPYADEEGPFRIDAIAPFYSPADSPEVKPGADVDLVLEVQPWLEGVVIAPAQGLGLVTLYTDRGRQTTKVNADGSFLFEGLDPGIVDVVAEVNPYGAASEQIELRAGNGYNVRLRIRARNRVRIFGDILGWPGKGKGWINGVEVAISANGRYEFKEGVIGPNRIVLDAPNKALFERTFDVKGRKKSKYDFRIEAEAFIAGRVVAADSRVSVQGAEVRVGLDYNDRLNVDRIEQFPLERIKPVLTDANGRFEVRRLQRGAHYLISVVKHPYGQALEAYTAKTMGIHRIELPTQPFIFGRLRGLGGVPRNAVVTARRLNPASSDIQFNVPDWDRGKSGRDNKGFYGLSGLLPDVYVIRAESVGYGAIETVVDLTRGGRARVDMRLRKGDFGEDEDAELLKRLPPVVEDLDDVDEELRADGTILTVDTRRSENAVPFPGVRVSFFDGELEFTAPMSFSEEKFELFGLPEATYRAVLSHPLLEDPIIIDNIRLVRGEPFTLVLKQGED